MSQFPRWFKERLERRPSQLKEDVYDFAQEQGYRIAEPDSEGDEFFFHVLSDETFTIADKKKHEFFRDQLCILSETIPKENLILVDDPTLGPYLTLKSEPV